MRRSVSGTFALEDTTSTSLSHVMNSLAHHLRHYSTVDRHSAKDRLTPTSPRATRLTRLSAD
eukprot:1349494-Amorphochlora_amoeboformis.AAC.1